MKKFIELTVKDTKTFISVDNIIRIQPSDKDGVIIFTKNEKANFVVQETYEEVISIILDTES